MNGDKFAFADGEVNAAQYPSLPRPGFITAFDILELDHDG
jgi:hypothetical protein